MIEQLTFRETENYLVQLAMCMTGCLADAYVHLLTLVDPVIQCQTQGPMLVALWSTSLWPQLEHLALATLGHS